MSETPEFTYKIGDSEIRIKPTEENINLAIVIRSKEDVVLKKTDDGIVVGVKIPAYYGVSLALTSLIAYNKYRKKQRESRRKKSKEAIDLDELFGEVSTKKKEKKETSEEEESEEEESELISAME